MAITWDDEKPKLKPTAAPKSSGIKWDDEPKPPQQSEGLLQRIKGGTGNALGAIGHAVQHPLDTIGQAYDVTSEIPLAWTRGDTNERGQTFKPLGELPELFKLYGQGKFREAQDEYSAGSPGELKYGVSTGNKISEARSKNPLLNAGMTFGEQAINIPGNVGLGAATGLGLKGIGALAKLVPGAEKAGDAIAAQVNRYHRFTKGVAQAVKATGASSKAAQAAGTEAEGIVRAGQSEVASAPGRAYREMQKLLKGKTAAEQAAIIAEHEFPIAGKDAPKELFEHFRGQFVKEATEKLHKNVSEFAERHGIEVPKMEHPELWPENVTPHGAANHLADLVKQAPAAARKIVTPQEDAHMRSFAQRIVNPTVSDTDKSVVQRVVQDAEKMHPQDADAQAESIMRGMNHFADPELDKLLQGTFETFKAPKAAEGIVHFFQKLSYIQKVGLIAQPLYHGVHNLFWQFTNAGGDLVTAMRYFSGTAKSDFKKWSEMAEQHGATFEQAPIGASSDRASEMTNKFSTLGPVAKVRRVVNETANANSKVTFDYFEKRWATALFKTYVEKGMSPEKAAIQTRRYLGDYLNQTGADHALASVINFAPWLKVLAYTYPRAYITHPQLNSGLQNVIGQYNSATGDPEIGKTYPSNPFAISLGNGAYLNTPIPGRFAADLSARGVSNMILHRANMPIAALTKAAITANSSTPPGNPGEGVGENYNLLYDRDAPTMTQYGQILKNTAGSILPLQLQDYFITKKTPKQSPLQQIGNLGLGLDFNNNDDKPTRKFIAKKISQRNRQYGKLKAAGADQSDLDSVYEMWQEIIDAYK